MSYQTECTIKLLRRFQAGALLTAKQVANQYGVNIRTAQRWLSDMARTVPLRVAMVGTARVYRL